ncbi:MAG TPA: DUF4202 domain-containing protein [Casimicrobiaceae bacterium]|nr:DUF4202 domain-containing protein [Casimicrobiaceae bacterium]
MSTSDRFADAIRRFDAANAEDPNREAVEGREHPKSLLYAERLTAMLARFAPDASEALQLAARCQHLQRWKIPRSDYPMTRAGYHQWRNRLRDFHAELARAILVDAGYDDATIARVASLIRKEALKTDGETQALEDVVALVFLESYLVEFVAGHGDYEAAKLADILTKTARKMSPRGREAALTEIALPEGVADIVRNAIGGVPAGAR